MRKTLSALVLAAGVALVAHAQITIPNSFTNGTTADADQVNANFTVIGSQALNRTGGTMTGTLNVQALAPVTDASYALGDGTHRFTTGSFSGALAAASLTTTGNVTAATLTSTGNVSVGSTTTLNSQTYTWPASQTANYVLATNGSGTLSWVFTNLVTVTPTKVATYTAAIGEFVVASGTFTVNLPAASGNSGKLIDVKNIGTGTITVDGNASETIDGALTYALTIQYQSLTLVCDGSNWYIR